MKYRLVDRKKKDGRGDTLDTQYLIDGEWVVLESPPSCGKAPKKCPTCHGAGVVT